MPKRSPFCQYSPANPCSYNTCFFFFLDLQCTGIKFLRFGGEGAQGKRHFSYILRRNKKLPQHSQRQQENQKQLSNILFRMKTRQLKTRMTLNIKGPCLQLLLKTNLKEFVTKKISPESAITRDCGDVTSSHKASLSAAEGGLASPRHCRLPGQHRFPSLPGPTTASCSSLSPRK